MTALDAALLLPFTLCIGLWVAWSDMKFMKIPNISVIALALVWLVLGVFLVDWPVWVWGLALAAMMLLLGFVASSFGLFGAGDAKFLAAMAPFFAAGDLRFVLLLSAGCLLGAFAAHRLARAIPAVRRIGAEWQSWTRADFPMGLALAGILNIFMFFAALPLVLA